jgi:Ni/Co efflux regulator RcnB
MKTQFAIAAAISLLVPALALAAPQHDGKPFRVAETKHEAEHKEHKAEHREHKAVHHEHKAEHREHKAEHREHRAAAHYGHGTYHGPRGNRFWYHGHYAARIHGGPWAWPHGFAYHRYYVGGILPTIFLGPTYVYADYAGLGLVAPEPGFVWVRYGSDLVLVNQETGAITEVSYGVFL